MKKLLTLTFLIFTCSAFAQVKISDMTTASSFTGTEFFPIVQSGLNKKTTLNSIQSYLTLPWSRITSRPTTLAGYGITNAWPLNGSAAMTSNVSIDNNGYILDLPTLRMTDRSGEDSRVAIFDLESNIPEGEAFVYSFPPDGGTLALLSDISNYTANDGITLSGNTFKWGVAPITSSKIIFPDDNDNAKGVQFGSYDFGYRALPFFSVNVDGALATLNNVSVSGYTGMYNGTGGNQSYLQLQNSGSDLLLKGMRIQSTTTANTLTDTRTVKKGLEYAADYSADYTNRSLVDRAYVSSLIGGDIDLVYKDFSDFYESTLSNGWAWVSSGSGATSVVSDYGTNGTEKASGVLSMTTGTTSTGETHHYKGHAGGFPTSFLIGNGSAIKLKWRVALSALSNGTDTYSVTLGLGDQINLKNQGYGVYFTYTHGTNGGEWEAVTASSSTRTTVDTNVTPSTSYQVLELRINSAGNEVTFYIDGTLVATTTTNIPASTTCAIMINIVKSLGTTSRSLYMDYYGFETTRLTAR